MSPVNSKVGEKTRRLGYLENDILANRGKRESTEENIDACALIPTYVIEASCSNRKFAFSATHPRYDFTCTRFDPSFTCATRILHGVFQSRENPELAVPMVHFMKLPLFDLSLQHNSFDRLDVTGKRGSLAVRGCSTTVSYLPIIVTFTFLSKIRQCRDCAVLS
ncbi:hypothetical protein ANTQUA_LOCUS2130 [Anthophora quadrimaculata]